MKKLIDHYTALCAGCKILKDAGFTLNNDVYSALVAEKDKLSKQIDDMLDINEEEDQLKTVIKIITYKEAYDALIWISGEMAFDWLPKGAKMYGDYATKARNKILKDFMNVAHDEESINNLHTVLLYISQNMMPRMI